MNKFLFLAVFLTHPAWAAPYLWSVEKDGKTAYLLGTIHYGVSFEELTCQDGTHKAMDYLNSADLVFTERTEGLFKNKFNLSVEDLRLVFASSQEEKQRFFKEQGFSQQKINLIEEFKINMLEEFKHLYLLQNFVGFVDNKKESAKDLNPYVKEFLVAHGVDLEEDFSNIAYWILFLNDFKWMTSTEHHMDLQIMQIAQDLEIPVLGLDDRVTVYNELDDLNIPEVEVNKTEIEASLSPNLITQTSFLEQDLEQRIDRLKNSNQNYLSGRYPFRADWNKDLKDIIFKNRNQVWVDKLLQAFEKQKYNSIFLAGGLHHFIADDNVLDMLKAKGLVIKNLSCLKAELVPAQPIKKSKASQ